MPVPSWNLDDLYKGLTDPQIEQDLKVTQASAQEFSKSYETKVSTLAAEALGQAIKKYEEINETLGRISSFSMLVFEQDMSHEAGANFYQKIKESVTEISTNLVFFTLEINQVSEKILTTYFKDSKTLAHYKPWLRNIRVFRDHQLSTDMEKILHEKHLLSTSNWVRLYDETFSKLKFWVEGQEFDTSGTLNLFASPDGKLREKAAKAFGDGLKNNISLNSLVLNTIAKDHEIEDRWRGYKHPISSRNKENLVEDEVVEALISSVKESYISLSHRYYKLKAKWMGQTEIPYWDRNAPLPEDEGRKFSWEDSKEIVLKSYRTFSPTMADIGQKFFDHQWIDAALRPGKDNGAFSHPTVPSVHPYILQNYHGKIWDVMTLAHELGHGIHQCLSNGQGYLMADAPLTLAETASIFGEMLTFQSLLSETTDPLKRKIILVGKVGDMLNSIVRQIAFCSFEKEFHQRRKKSELSVEEIGEIWTRTQAESLGPSIRLTEEYKYYWSYISHFVHAPFYVYAYAFGNCLVNSLYAVYQEGLPNFEEKYINLLKAGGSAPYYEVLAPFNLDARDPNFWKKGLKVISSFIDELEALP